MIDSLVVGFSFNPAARWQGSKDVLAALVVHENEKGKGHGRCPPLQFQGVHAKTLVHACKIKQ